MDLSQKGGATQKRLGTTGLKSSKGTWVGYTGVACLFPMGLIMGVGGVDLYIIIFNLNSILDTG